MVRDWLVRRSIYKKVAVVSVVKQRWNACVIYSARRSRLAIALWITVLCIIQGAVREQQRAVVSCIRVPCCSLQEASDTVSFPAPAPNATLHGSDGYLCRMPEIRLKVRLKRALQRL